MNGTGVPAVARDYLQVGCERWSRLELNLSLRETAR